MRKAKSVKEACRAYAAGRNVIVTLRGTGEQIPLYELFDNTTVMIEESKPEAKQIDVGKILALYKAGWKGKDIARDMHISQSTVSRYIKQAMETIRKPQP